MLDLSSEQVLDGPVAALENKHGGIILKDSDDFKLVEMGQLRTLSVPKLSVGEFFRGSLYEVSVLLKLIGESLKIVPTD